MGQDQQPQQAPQHDPDQESPYFTADEVAKFLRVTKQTALRWLKSGVIPGGFQLTEGGVWRINRETFLAWLQERERDAYQQRMVSNPEKGTTE